MEHLCSHMRLIWFESVFYFFKTNDKKMDFSFMCCNLIIACKGCLNHVVFLQQCVGAQPLPPREEEEEEDDERLSLPGSNAPSLHQGEGGDEEKEPQCGSPQPGRRCG